MNCGNFGKKRHKKKLQRFHRLIIVKNNDNVLNYIIVTPTCSLNILNYNNSLSHSFGYIELFLRSKIIIKSIQVIYVS